MSSIVSTIQSGNASNTTTWSTSALPNDGDTIIVSPGNILTWDLNWANNPIGNTFAVSGTFLVPNTLASGSYGITLNGNMTLGASGCVLVGQDINNRLPPQTIFIFNTNTYSFVQPVVSGNIQLYGSDPINPYAYITQTVVMGATGFTVDRDLTGDPLYSNAVWIWQTGAGGATNSYCTCPVLNVTSSTITLASSSVAVGYTNIQGVPVYSLVFPRRNVIFNGSTPNLNGKYNIVVGCEFYNTSGLSFLGAYPVNIVGGLIHSYGNNGAFGFFGNTVTASGTSFTMPGDPVFKNMGAGGIVTANNCYFIGDGNQMTYSVPSITLNNCELVGISVLGNSSPINMNNCLVQGCYYILTYKSYFTNCMFKYCDFLFNGGVSNYVSNCTIQQCQYPILGTVGYVVSDTTFIGNSYNIYRPNYSITCRNLTSSGVTHNDFYRDTSGTLPSLVIYGYTTTTPVSAVVSNTTTIYAPSGDSLGIVIWNFNGILKYPYAWQYGGRIISQTTITPTGQVEACQFICENYPRLVYVDFPFTAPSGSPVSISVWMQKDTLGMYITPQAQIVDPDGGQFDTSSILSSYTMVDNTNTWQTATLTYTSPYDRPLIFRVIASGGTVASPQNVYWSHQISMLSLGGGGSNTLIYIDGE